MQREWDGGEGARGRAAESLGQGFAINCLELSFSTIEVDVSLVVTIVALKSNWSYWGP